MRMTKSHFMAPISYCSCDVWTLINIVRTENSVDQFDIIYVTYVCVCGLMIEVIHAVNEVYLLKHIWKPTVSVLAMNKY